VRRSTLLLSAVLAVGTLTGCSGGGPYCDAVDAAKEPLTTFGQRNDGAFASYADATTKIAKVAPADVQKEWKAIARATRKVVAAHRKAEVPMQDMKDEVTVNSLSQDDLDRIQTAYEEFNDTAIQRRDMVQDVHDECGIDLSDK
jgi:hypothetical protein